MLGITSKEMIKGLQYVSGQAGLIGGQDIQIRTDYEACKQVMNIGAQRRYELEQFNRYLRGEITEQEYKASK